MPPGTSGWMEMEAQRAEKIRGYVCIYIYIYNYIYMYKSLLELGSFTHPTINNPSANWPD